MMVESKANNTQQTDATEELERDNPPQGVDSLKAIQGGIHVPNHEESDGSFDVVNEEESDEFSSYVDEDESGEDEESDEEDDDDYEDENEENMEANYEKLDEAHIREEEKSNDSLSSDDSLSSYEEDEEEANYEKLDETHIREEEKSDDSLSSYGEDEEESDKGERDMPRVPLFLVEAPNIPELRATKLTQGQSPSTPVVGQPEVPATVLNSFEKISSEVEKVSSLPSFSSRFQPHGQRAAIEYQLQSLRWLAKLSLSDIVRNGKLSELKQQLKLRQAVNRQHKFEVLLLLLDGLGANLPEEIECMDSVDSAPRKESCLQQTVLDQFKELNSNKDNLNVVQVQIDELKAQLKALEARKFTLNNDGSIIQTELEKSLQDLKLLKEKPVPTPEEYNRAKAIVDVIDRAWETAMANPW